MVGTAKQGNAGLAALTALILSLCLSATANAQVVGGSLSGTVTDQSGAVIPDPKISIKNTATGVTREVRTDSAGFYSAPNLQPGVYDVTTSAPGFSTQVQTGITISVGASQALNISLRVGQVNQRVEVTGAAPMVELTTSSIGAVVNSTTVRELPLNGRSWTDLADLQPGVAVVQTQVGFDLGQVRGNRGFGDQISIAGARPQQNNYRLDGISITDYSNGGPGSVLGGNLGVDAIQEFSVITSNISAEYGRTSGGVVNAITRSGTNQFHGGAYEFFRNNALDARNFFDGAKIPPFHRNQFGADAGGPIRKDKMFFFGDYEGLRNSEGITHLDTVPSVKARSGTLCSAPDTTPACSPMAVIVDPSVQKFLPFWPLPNQGILAGTNGDLGILTFAGQQVVNEDFGTGRLDYIISGKDSLAATYMGDVTPYQAPDALNNVLINSKTNRQIATLEETHIFGPTLVNSARIGYNRQGVTNNGQFSAINPLANNPSLGAVPGRFAPQVRVSGLTNFQGGVNGGTLAFFNWNSFQGYDDASWTHGSHYVKFGGGVERIDYNASTLGNSGRFKFKTLSNFLTNKPKSLGLDLPSALYFVGFRQTLLGLYVQDDWRLRPNLTLNLGLRYEMATVPTEVHDRLSNLVNITDPTPHLGSPFFSNPTLRNFEPRVGFAWDPFHNGKTAVHGGFGVFDVLPLPYQFYNLETTAAPFVGSAQTGKLPQGSFYTGAAGLLTRASDTASYIEQHPHRSYIMQWNLNVQRQLGQSVTALVSYVGSHGVHLPFRVDDADIVLPKQTQFGYLFPSPVGSGMRINPNFGAIGSLTYRENSSYNALGVGVQKAMSHGVQLQGSFTWSKSIDEGSSTGFGDSFSNSIASLPWYALKSVRGVSDFNIGRILVINGIWQIPAPKSVSEPLAWIANGWQLGAIFRASDGVPFTATWGSNGDPQGLNSGIGAWDFPTRLTGPGCGTLTNPGNPNHYIKTQCFAVPTAPSPAFYTANCDPNFGTSPQCFNLRGNAGRNILTGPGTSNLDFSAFKNNHLKRISENFNVQFRVEVFNILNRANFAVPLSPDNTDIFDASGAPTGVAGLLTSTTTKAREIQFALKLLW
jgi:hypothetical protein